MSEIPWKPNWDETKKHFNDFWNRKGVVIASWGPPKAVKQIEPVQEVGCPDIREYYLNPVLRAKVNHYRLSEGYFGADVLPLSDTFFGPGSLATFIGSEPGISDETIWFEPCVMNESEPEKLPPLKFDPENKWWKLTEQTLKECVRLGKGKYMVGCPDLVENIDVLSSLRDPQTLMFDMIERPEWVKQKVWEINKVWFEAYQRIYDIIKLDDGSSSWAAFRVWGAGKTAKLQCDASAMFSPEMFKEFVVPALTEQCSWLDNSLYHLDGTQAMCHLDALLAIKELDAIEWTPQAGIEPGAHPRWFDLYRKIIDAGKSVQIMSVGHDDLKPMLDKIGRDGIYVMTGGVSAAQMEKMYNSVH